MKIYGIHACKSAIKHKTNVIHSAFLLQNRTNFDFVKKAGIKIKFCTEREIADMLPKGAVHQGIVLEIDDSCYYANISDLKNVDNNCVLIMLDNINDPHNLGAIIRSAAVFGAYGVIVSEYGSCKLTETAVKTSCGGLEHTKFYSVKNLATTIKQLKEFGFWIYAFCEDGAEDITKLDLKGRICMIFGAEQTGIRQLQRKNADFLTKIPTSSDFSTLNVSNAAAVALYEAHRQLIEK